MVVGVAGGNAFAGNSLANFGIGQSAWLTQPDARRARNV